MLLDGDEEVDNNIGNYTIHLVTPLFEGSILFTCDSTCFGMQILSFADSIVERYVSFDFSNILIFSNPIPEGERCARFKRKDWEVVAEHLLDFHECMH